MERKKNSFFHLSERTDRLLRWGKITVTEDMFKTIGNTTATAPIDKKSHQNIVRVPYEDILILICGKKKKQILNLVKIERRGERFMKKNKCLMMCLCALAVAGCTQTKKPVYEEATAMVSTIQSGEKGEDGFLQLDVKGVADKLEAKEDFVVMVSSSTCSHCNNMKLKLYPYLSEYTDIPFFEVEIDQLGSKKADVNGFIEELEKLVGFSGGTPEFFHIQDGEIKDTRSGEMSKSDWHAFMQECGYVSEEESLKASSSQLAQSKRFDESTFTEIAEKIENGNAFYVLCVENDRYGAMFTNTLKTYIEEHEINVRILNFSSPKTEMDQEKMQTSYESVVNTLQVQMTPSLYKIEDKKVVKALIDNATADEVKTFFEE